ncbi:MAG TPA: monofunctional biosynthetic peptidoglycan transglycosylase [Afifellaceae bacterium]|nr:monofunctional biosynthetic peptidoglycan transglycosylase [Afifellaceae bacterium]
MVENGIESRHSLGGVREARRPGLVRRLVGRLAVLCVILVALPVVLIPLYRTVDPPVTTVMLINKAAGVAMERQWVPFDDISPHLVRAVVMSEDGRFCSHSGIDWEEVRRVLDRMEDGGRPRGASTITMQTVKNLFLWPQRSWLRKGLEVPLALYADFVLPKRRILEIYLNIAEWGTGLYGAEAAAQHYFGVAASALSPAQAARLAAALPAPRERNPANPGRVTARLASIIANRAAKSGAYVRCVLE